MAKTINYFLNSRLDSDTHESLVDDKSCTTAENLRISGVGSNGAYKNMYGSELVSDHSENGTMVVVGMYEGLNNKLYYFLAHSNGKSKIIEYDVVTKISRIIIQDNYVLRFDLVRWNKGVVIFPFKYILSINQMGDLLTFSNEVWRFPRTVNLKRIADYASGFTEDDISLAKKPPVSAPIILSRTAGPLTSDKENANKFVSFSYRYKYKDGDYSSLSFYSDCSFIPDAKEIKTGPKRENKSMVNQWQSLMLTVNTGGKNVTDIEVYAREHGSNTAYLIYNTNKKNNNLLDNSQIPITYKYSNNYEVLNQEDTELMYNNTPMFPKTQDAAGSRMIYSNYKEGFPLVSNDQKPVFVDYVVEKIQKEASLTDKKTAVSLFSYKVVALYLNDYNMSTTGLLPQDQEKSEITVEFEDRLKINQLQVKFPKGFKHPAFATKLKFAVKSQSLNYDIVYTTVIRKTGNKLYIKIDGENVNKVRVGEILIPIGDGFKYMECLVDEIKLLRVADGLVSVDGNYAVVSVEDSFETKKNEGEDLKKNYQERGIIDYREDLQANPERWTSLSGEGGEHRTVINYSDFGAISAGDTVNISITFDYYQQDTSSVNNAGSSDFDFVEPIKFDFSFFSENNYANIGDLISDQFTDYRFTITKNLTNITLDTNLEYAKFISDNYNGLYTWRGYKKFSNLSTRNWNLAVDRNSDIFIKKGYAPVIFRTKNKEEITKFYFETSKEYFLNNGMVTPDSTTSDSDVFNIGFYNGYSSGNGVESYKVRDEFLGKKLNFNFRGTLVEPNGYKEIHRKDDITHSGLFNYELGLNRLSNFNPSVANWKTLPIRYGEVERIMSTDGDISIFATNKVMSLLYGKSLIMDLKGDSNLALSDEVFGDVDELDYENGISYNPESIAKNGNMIFFIDKLRARYMVKIGKELHEISGNGSLFMRESVENLNKHDSFLGAFDDAHGEYVCSLNHDRSTVFNMDHKGFVQYMTNKIDYHFGMSGKFFVAYEGRIYESYVNKNFNVIAGQELESKLRYIINKEIDSDKIFKAMYLNSNQAWNVSIRTNYTEATIPEKQFEQKESFFFTDINRNTKGNHTSSGIGVVKEISGDKIIFYTDVPYDVSIGDFLQGIDSEQEYEITDIDGDSISIADNSMMKVGDYLFGNKNHKDGYRPDGEPIRGKWMEVTLTKKTKEELYITSVTTEISESNL